MGSVIHRRTFLGGLSASAVLGLPAAARGLVLASNEVYPLLYRGEEGSLSGYLHDLVVEAARRAGFPAEIRMMPWPRCVEETRNGNIDGLFVIFRTAERETFLSFTNEVLMVQKLCFFARRDSGIHFDGQLGSLSGYRIAAANKVSYGRAFDAAVGDGTLRRIELVSGPEVMVRMLLGGRVDLFVLHDLEGFGMLRKLGAEDKVTILSPPLDEVSGYLAFTRARDLTPLVPAFDEALASMRRDGAYQQLYSRYFP